MGNPVSDGDVAGQAHDEDADHEQDDVAGGDAIVGVHGDLFVVRKGFGSVMFAMLGTVRVVAMFVFVAHG